jgi:mannose-6-phosphate isomerase-like protein (cupin superfamily)
MTDTIAPQRFAFAKPETDRVHHVVKLANTDRMHALVHVLKKGGENNLHSHTHQDGLWFVLNGGARFYGEGDTLIGEIGPHEGILIPRGTRYWFESSGETELLHVIALDEPQTDERKLVKDRINYEPTKANIEAIPVTQSSR